VYEVLGAEVMSLEFSGKNVTLVVASQEDHEIKGTYKIGENDDGETVITFDFGDEDDAEDYNGELPFAEGEEDGVKYIKIGGIKLTKE